MRSSAKPWGLGCRGEGNRSKPGKTGPGSASKAGIEETKMDYQRMREIWPLQVTEGERKDARLMLEALTELERFQPGDRPVWDMEPWDEYERRR